MYDRGLRVRTRPTAGPLQLLAIGTQYNIVAIFGQHHLAELTFPSHPRGYSPIHSELYYLTRALVDRVCSRLRLSRITVAPIENDPDQAPEDQPDAIPGFQDAAFVRLEMSFEDRRLKRVTIKIEPTDEPPRKRIRAARRTL